MKDYDEFSQKATLLIEQCASSYSIDEEYKELSILLGFLRSLGMIHHSHHWQTLGDSYFGDHLLYERLYKTIEGEVDVLGEKVVGVGSPALTNYFRQLLHMKTFMKAINQGDPLITESFRAEILFVLCGELIVKLLERSGLLTTGIEQAVGNILDKHEGHIYFLKQRTTKGTI